MEDEFSPTIFNAPQNASSNEPSILPDNGIEKPPVPALSGFDFKEEKERLARCEGPARRSAAFQKFADRLEAEDCDLPDRIDLRLTTELDPKQEVVGLRLFVNRHEVKKGGIICPFELLRSTYLSDGFFIHSCSCHSPECAGIWGSTLVADLGDWILWETNDKVVNQVFLFDSVEYRREVFAVCWRAFKALESNKNWILEMEHVDGNVLRQAWKSARRHARKRVTCEGTLRRMIISVLMKRFQKE
jgi:hypothetical protein